MRRVTWVADLLFRRGAACSESLTIWSDRSNGGSFRTRPTMQRMAVLLAAAAGAGIGGTEAPGTPSARAGGPGGATASPEPTLEEQRRAEKKPRAVPADGFEVTNIALSPDGAQALVAFSAARQVEGGSFSLLTLYDT